MTMEKEKEMTKKKPGEDGPIDEPGSPQSGEGSGTEDDLKKKADETKEDVEKYRRRSREKFAKVEAEDTQPRQKYKQHGGE